MRSEQQSYSPEKQLRVLSESAHLLAAQLRSSACARLRLLCVKVSAWWVPPLLSTFVLCVPIANLLHASPCPRSRSDGARPSTPLDTRGGRLLCHSEQPFPPGLCAVLPAPHQKK